MDRHNKLLQTQAKPHLGNLPACLLHHSSGLVVEILNTVAAWTGCRGSAVTPLKWSPPADRDRTDINNPNTFHCCTSHCPQLAIWKVRHFKVERDKLLIKTDAMWQGCRQNCQTCLHQTYQQHCNTPLCMNLIVHYLYPDRTVLPASGGCRSAVQCSSAAPHDLSLHVATAPHSSAGPPCLGQPSTPPPPLQQQDCIDCPVRQPASKEELTWLQIHS